jgi:hypothetical protein
VTNIRHIIIAYHCDYSVEYMVRNQLTIWSPKQYWQLVGKQKR